MKFKIELDSDLTENEFIIRCASMDPAILKIQQAVADIVMSTPKIPFYKGETEYYLPLEDILFFETSQLGIETHTADDMFQVKYRLYELEEILPNHFLRVSKSTILNADKIFSINRSLTSSNLVQFYKSHKQVYVSRYYYKHLRKRLDERR